VLVSGPVFKTGEEDAPQPAPRARPNITAMLKALCRMTKSLTMEGPTKNPKLTQMRAEIASAKPL
jgi:hypothetical protein